MLVARQLMLRSPSANWEPS